MENPDFEQLVSRIQAGEQAAMEELYKLFSRGIRYYLCRQLGPQGAEDRLHDVFVIVIEAIQRGDVREPYRLMGFVRTVAQRQVAAVIENLVAMRANCASIDADIIPAFESAKIQASVFNKSNPEQEFALKERTALIKTVLDSMTPRDREVLTRFYLDEQSKEQIQQEMNLTPTQLRLIKSRAKAKFGEIGRKKLTSNGIFSVFARNNNQRNKLKLMQLGAPITEKKAA